MMEIESFISFVLGEKIMLKKCKEKINQMLKKAQENRKTILTTGAFLVVFVFALFIAKKVIFPKKTSFSGEKSKQTSKYSGQKAETAEKEDKEFRQVIDIENLKKTKYRGILAFERSRDIWSANFDGKNEQRLTTYQGLWSPRFSSDGKWIAYSSIPKELLGEGVAPTPSNIWIITPDGSDYKKLSQKYRVSTSAVWSLDSKKLAIATSDSTIVVFDIESGQELEFVRDAGPLGVVPYPPLWITKDTFVYFKKLPDSPEKAGLAIADIKTQEIDWLAKEPGITNIASYSNGEKLVFLQDNKLYDLDVKSRQAEELSLDIDPDLEFTGELKVISGSNLLIGPVRSKSEKSSKLKLDFLLIDLLSGKSRLVKTGLYFKKDLGWSSDGYWLLLNAISDNDDISSIWQVNLQTGKKDQIISNTQSATWSF